MSRPTLSLQNQLICIRTKVSTLEPHEKWEKKKKSNPTSDLMTLMCAMCRYTLGKQHTQCRSPRRTLKVHEATVTGELNRTISQNSRPAVHP